MLDWIQSNIPPWLPILFIVHFVVLGTVSYLILLERKVASWVQDRLGPNRTGLDFGLAPLKFLRGLNGLGQPLADGLKFIVKEDFRAKSVDVILFTIAPISMITVIIVSIAVIPWGGILGTQTTYDITQQYLAAQDNRASVAIATQAQEIERSLPSFHHIVGNVTLQAVPAGSQVDFYADPEIPTWYTTAEGDVAPGQPPVELQPGQALYATFTTGWYFQIANLNIGVLFVVATLSLAVYGVVIGGWASNNKYSFLGGLRATANMISYEIPMGLTILTIVILFGTLDLGEIVENQAHYWAGWIPAWNVFIHPLAFVMFLVCIHAEANRAPFDTAEAEQELVGGYHTEYSSMRFALFFLAEYAGMITTSAVMVALFLGGWHFPGLTGHDPANPAVTDSLGICLLRALVFFVKTIFILFVFMWVRWSLPRFRFDQIMNLAWRGLIPVSLAILLATALTIYFFGPTSEKFLNLRRIDGAMAWIMLATNVVVAALVMIGSRLIPAGANLNKKVRIPGSRFNYTPLPGDGAAASPAAQPATA